MKWQLILQTGPGEFIKLNDGDVRGLLRAIIREIATTPSVEKVLRERVEASTKRDIKTAAAAAVDRMVTETAEDAIKYFSTAIVPKIRGSIASLVQESIDFAFMDASHSPNVETFRKRALASVRLTESRRLGSVSFRKRGQMSVNQARALRRLHAEGYAIFSTYSKYRREWSTADEAQTMIQQDRLVTELPKRRREMVRAIVKRAARMRTQDRAPSTLAAVYAVAVSGYSTEGADVPVRTALRQYKSAQRVLAAHE